MDEFKLKNGESNEFLALWKCSVGLFIIKILSDQTCSKFEEKIEEIKSKIVTLKKEFLFSDNQKYYEDLMSSLNEYSKKFFSLFRSYDFLIDKILEDNLRRKDLTKSINYFITLKYVTEAQKNSLVELRKLLNYLDKEYFEILKEIMLNLYEDESGISEIEEIKDHTYEYLVANKEVKSIIYKTSEITNEHKYISIEDELEKSGIHLNENLAKILDFIVEKDYDHIINIIDSNINKHSNESLLLCNSSYDATINFINQLGSNIILNNKLFRKVLNEGFYNPVSRVHIRGLNIIDFNKIENNKFEYLKGYSYRDESKTLNIDGVIFINKLPVVFLFKKSNSLRSMYENVMDFVDVFPEAFTFIQKIIMYDDSRLLMGSLFDDIDDYEEIIAYTQKGFNLESIIKSIVDTNNDHEYGLNKIGLRSIVDSFLKEDFKTITNILNFNINKYSDNIFNYSTYEYASNFIYEIKKYSNIIKKGIFKKNFVNEDGVQNNEIKLINSLNYSKNRVDLLIDYKLDFNDLFLFVDGIMIINFIPTILYLEEKEDPKKIIKKIKEMQDKKIFQFLNNLIIKHNDNIYFGYITEDFDDYKNITSYFTLSGKLSTKTLLNYKDVFLDLILEKCNLIESMNNEAKKLRNNDSVKNILKTNKEKNIEYEKDLPIDYSDEFLDLLDDEEEFDLDSILDNENFENFLENADFNFNSEYIGNIIEKNSKEDKELLVKANEGLVYKFANKYYRFYRPRCLDLDDIIQFGQVGLLKAAERFDFSKGTNFSTYAVIWIKQSIGRGIQDMGEIVRIPVHINEKINKLTRLEKKSESLYGYINDDYIIEEMDETLEKIKNYRLVRYRFLKTPSLDIKVGEDGDTNLKEFIEDPQVNIEQEYEINNLKALINRELNKLDDREKIIIKQRFGLDGYSPMTLEEVGKEFGVTRERIRQVENKVLKKLKYNRTIKGCRNYI
ncbi:sigma-70 family RNA polymerase sigma factor [Peptoniphilus genitalis]|uniref:RNA polymerase sigma factor n=1 Tax=Peptoniphilus genitalis TaxID=3036303 RepID=A0ABY4TQJ2_9FIRM|nr:sigma-70 family RNA polymerase sigma factor [Peptoniphilus sp. SAHP1]URN42133.1 sigma-70 family RNA polymerase sigma factor [Peptoniphilus sp. SAHP1]